MWVQQLNKLGLISMNKAGYAGKRGRHDDKTCATRNCKVSRLLEHTTVEKLQIFNDEDNEELEHDVRSFVDKKRLISRRPF